MNDDLKGKEAEPRLRAVPDLWAATGAPREGNSARARAPRVPRARLSEVCASGERREVRTAMGCLVLRCCSAGALLQSSARHPAVRAAIALPHGPWEPGGLV